MSGRTTSPTIADVARVAGVSISTVSRIINASELVADDTVQKVREAIEQLGYQPRSAARSLALRRTNTLGILLESLADTFFPTVIAGAEEIAYQNGYSLLIARQSHAANGFLPALGPFNTDGLLAINIELSKNLVAHHNEGYPIVTLYNPAPKKMNVPFITIDNKRGVFSLIEHLIRDHGLRRIGLLRGAEGENDAAGRLQGYLLALKKYDIPVDPRLIADCRPGKNIIRDVVLQWWRDGILPQAIFTGSDEGSLYAMMALSEIRVHVPEDVAVVGFDDTEMAARLYPPLTTVHAQPAEVGREATRKLLELIRTGQTAQVTTLPTRLVTRKSCGCSNAPNGTEASVQSPAFEGVYQNNNETI
jgi:DNA-binding LacI/PurR family transcriptional regulator